MRRVRLFPQDRHRKSGVRRTLFPELLIRYQLCDAKGKKLADIAMSFASISKNPLSLILPTRQTISFYRLKTEGGAESIEFGEAARLRARHEHAAMRNDVIGKTLSKIENIDKILKRIDAITSDQF
jgi:hypothetical protein